MQSKSNELTVSNPKFYESCSAKGKIGPALCLPSEAK